MKKSINILGLPIISITECSELGTSKGLMIDANKGIVAGILIEDDEWFRGAKILPFDAITAIGGDAITIMNDTDIIPLTEGADYEPLLVENIKIIGTKVITKTGSLYGKVTEIIIDDAGKIAECEIMNSHNAVVTLSADKISTYGKHVTIIENVEIEPIAPEPIKPTPLAQQSKILKSNQIDPAPIHPPLMKTTSFIKPSHMSDDEYKKTLLGHRAKFRLTTDGGVVIIEAGGEVTQEVLQKATLSKKIPELALCLQ